MPGPAVERIAAGAARQPVRAGSAEEPVGAAAAAQAVGAAAAAQRVAAARADERVRPRGAARSPPPDVLRRHRRDAARRGVAPVADLAQHGGAAPGHEVGAVGAHGVEAVRAAAHRVGRVVIGDERVAAGVAGEVVGAGAAGDDVVAGTAAARVHVGAAEQLVGPGAAGEQVRAGAADDPFGVDEVALALLAVASVPVERDAHRRPAPAVVGGVGAQPADEHVGAAAAVERVVAGPAEQAVEEAVADERVVADPPMTVSICPRRVSLPRALSPGCTYAQPSPAWSTRVIHRSRVSVEKSATSLPGPAAHDVAPRRGEEQGRRRAGVEAHLGARRARALQARLVPRAIGRDRGAVERDPRHREPTARLRQIETVSEAGPPFTTSESPSRTTPGPAASAGGHAPSARSATSSTMRSPCPTQRVSAAARDVVSSASTRAARGRLPRREDHRRQRA